ncbi:putative receptor-like protein kinase [Phytophthora citrophthora]|uniref:Receptor-like protein kinase n=1 Tax=Phytophthora citrophthora TaxID=4793 RepID=A0AAD9GSD9_9STRA|nr:putative receptor-like protein kinase [Phytophthora citrophthora]
MDDNAIVGYGGDAKIYKGTLTDGTPVAVKIFNENVARSEKKKEKFTSMMKLWQRLSHYSNVCHLYGACYFTAAPFVVMEYCDVGPLDKYLRQMGSNRYRASLEVLAQAAQGIAKMHSIGIVHGDLKCDNILITGTPPTAKVSDFDRSFDWIALKNKGLVNGTAKDAGVEITDAIRYLAPECDEGKLPNFESDVYSFGLTIYHALVGKSPYYEITNDGEFHRCKVAHQLPKRDPKAIPDGAWTLISQCCDGAPDKRPVMPKVAETLRLLLGKPSEGKPTETLANAGVDAETIPDQVNAPVQDNRKQPTLPVLEKQSGSSHVGKETNAQQPQQPGKMTPRKISKANSRGISPFHIGIGVLITLVIVAVVTVVVLAINGLLSGSSSDNSSFTSSYSDASSSSSSSSSSSLGSGIMPTPTPAPTPTPTTSQLKVSTVLEVGKSLLGNGDSKLFGIEMTSDDQWIIASNVHRFFMGKDNGYVIQYAGSSSPGFGDDYRLSSYLNAVYGITVAPDGTIVFCDTNDDFELVVRTISSDWIRTIWTGNTSFNTSSGVGTGSSSLNSAARGNSSVEMGIGIAADSNLNVYMNFYGANKLMKLSNVGIMRTIAKGTELISPSGPMGLALDSSSNIYITDHHRVVKFTSNGKMTVLAGSATPGFANGIGTSAQFDTPKGLTIGSDGNLYIVDSGNNCIRKLTLNGNSVTTYAGKCAGESSGVGSFSYPRSITATGSGDIYVIDSDARIQKISAA